MMARAFSGQFALLKRLHSDRADGLFTLAIASLLDPGADSMTPLIEVRDLHFQYEDGTKALDGVNFTLNAGETVAVFGANGSGKTTFVLHLNGILRGQGSVTVCGMPVNKDARSRPFESGRGVSRFRRATVHADGA